MLRKEKQTGAVPARPADDLVPGAGRESRGRLRAVARVAAAAVVPVLFLVAPVDGPARRFLYVGALTLVWAFVVGAVVRRRAPRRWTGVAIGTGLAVLGEAARMLSLSSGTNAFLQASDGLRIAAYVVLVVGFGAIVRTRNSDNGRASVLDGAIVGCALFATCWPMLAYPSVMTRTVDTSGGWPGVGRSFLAIVVCAVGVRLLFRPEASARLLYFGIVPIAVVDLFEGSGVTHSAGSGRGALELSALFAFSMIAIATYGTKNHEETELVEVDPANRIRVLCILTSVALCSAIPLADAWSAGHRDVSTLVPGVCAIAMFVLIALRLWHLAAGARAAGMRYGLRRLGALVQGLHDAIFVVDRDGLISYASPRANAMLGAAGDDLIGRRFDESLGAEESDRVARQLRAAAKLPTGMHEEVVGGFIDGSGAVRDFEMGIVNMIGDKDVAGLVVTMRDVTVKRELTRELEQRVFRDDLTKLANRSLFLDRLDQARLRSRRTGIGLAVMFIDLDDFKAVNDGLGHAAGDTLLCAVSGRLSECLRPSDTIARLGGDEFAVLLDGVVDVAEVMTIAHRLLEVLQLPVEIDELAVTVPASIGIAMAEQGHAHSNLMRDADIALYRAKEQGKNRIALFDTSMGWEAYSRLRLRTQLESAIENDELRVLFQPIISLGTNEIVGVEALVRWEHPKLGTLSPSEFVPIAEESALITVLGRWVLQQACAHAAVWNSGDRSLYVSVNVSARQLREVGFAAEISEALATSGLDPSKLMLELTESVLIDEVAGQNLVDNVAPLGVGIAIDDFGTGYSSLAYLQRFPVNVVKIDRSFVSRLNEDGMRQVVKSMAAISAVMGYTSIAEGVETPEEAADLVGLDYGFAQGFLYSHPVGAGEINALLDRDAPIGVEPAALN
ncbi:MAG TPA: EAL domain-containing protein [Acidimicrobiia bacterium]|nr:EAL domain-containing protein [Acidimicrobiia bacterium]